MKIASNASLRCLKHEKDNVKEQLLLISPQSVQINKVFRFFPFLLSTKRSGVNFLTPFPPVFILVFQVFLVVVYISRY